MAGIDGRKMKFKPEDFQVQFKDGTVKTVDKLTKAELQQQLCGALDAITAVADRASDAAAIADEWLKGSGDAPYNRW
jgi:hypothetical protein